MYASSNAISLDMVRRIRPPLRQTVTQSARQWLRVSRSGGGIEAWSSELTPYMVEPMDLLTSRRYEAVVFAGPARTGKTLAADAWMLHAILADPADMLIVHMTQETARDYSRLRVDRAIRHSPEIRAAMSPRARDDNTYDKFTRSGTIIKIAWPSISQLSGKEFKYAVITDLDRIDDDIDGEGDVFGLVMKRLQTYLSSGMLYAESSPGRECMIGNWRPSTPHEAPPVGGIIGLYNRADRRRWYWRCPECSDWFHASPGVELFALPEPDELLDQVKGRDLPAMAREMAHIFCPCCGSLIEERCKRALNRGGKWVIEGQTIQGDGEIIGEPRESRIAGFYLGGVAAAYQSWRSILLNYFEALKVLTATGDEEPLKRSITQDQGGVYVPRAKMKNRAGYDELMTRAEYWSRLTVPDGVRFLIAAVDVQINRFVVQIIGYGVDRQRWLIDRYNLSKSERLMDGKPMGVNPGGYAEDWDLLLPLIEKSYLLGDDSGRSMRILSVGCDSGGSDGVTVNAYEFWRRCHAAGLSAHPGGFSRFNLVKGEGKPNAPRVRIGHPDTSGRKDRNVSQGDVPVMFLGVQTLKDTIAMDLMRDTPGAGYFHFPQWVDDWWYVEMTREQRESKGWTEKSRNEAWDLVVYADAIAIAMGAEAINWNDPPHWASEWHHNSCVTGAAAQPKPKPRLTIKSHGHS